MDRFSFIKISGFAAGGMTLHPTLYLKGFQSNYRSRRPPVDQRKFTSRVIERTIVEVKDFIGNPELAWMFENCFPNTLDTTVTYRTMDGRPDTFVITGDIPAMWLRDSTAQVWPYLPFVNEDDGLKLLIQGVIHRQAELIRIDPYANAFNDGPAGSPWESDLTEMKPELHERKWEIDSLCYPVRLAYRYYRLTGDDTIFDESWSDTAGLILKTFREQQRKEGPGPYRFQRETTIATDTLPGNGYGNPARPNGLICSAFRPSDDATVFPYLVPSNLFAVRSLRQLSEIASGVYGEIGFAEDCRQLADEVDQAVKQYAVFDHEKYGKILAYEVDGYLNRLFMDDANIPSLLSLPYLGCIDADDPLYRNTRKYILGDDNPWYFTGTAAKGIGGPHVGAGMIWPLSIIMQAMTSDSDEEIAACIKTLLHTHAGTGFMHESFHKDNPENFTRSWFAWANTLFGELILEQYRERPHLLKEI
ncbi:MAG TPA: glycoside hydrolase family 125 protein [Bacteroides sp.]|nr:glycoside hydrolase family 125 protein [Bacteroides sp.]